MNDLELQDKALAAHFALTYKTQSVVQVFASPHRALSQVEKIYGVDKDRPKLPAMSIWRQDPVPAPDRWKYNTRFPLFSTPSDGSIVVVDRKPPLTVDIPYQIEIWSHTRVAMNLLLKNFLRNFLLDLTYITVDFGEPDLNPPHIGWGDKKLSIQLNSITDNSDLEPGEKGVKYRQTLATTLRGLIFAESYEEMKSVLEINSTFHDYDGDYKYDDWVSDKDGATRDITPPPYVGSITPNEGPAAGGTSVTITGGGFTNSSDTWITFDSDSATSVEVVDEFTLTCVTPSHSAGLADVIVNNSNGSGTLSEGFTFNP
jgi:hypothetical protein